MDGLEHKDQRLHAVEGMDWRDKLGKLRAEIAGDDGDGPDAGQVGDGEVEST